LNADSNWSICAKKKKKKKKGRHTLPQSHPAANPSTQLPIHSQPATHIPLLAGDIVTVNNIVQIIVTFFAAGSTQYKVLARIP